MKECSKMYVQNILILSLTYISITHNSLVRVLTTNHTTDTVYNRSNENLERITDFAIPNNATVLDISHNSVIKIGRNDFKNMCNLQRFYLSWNNIASVNYMSRCTHVEVCLLDLGHNNLVDFPKITSMGLSLKYLDLHNNSIEFVSEMVFQELSSLVYLDLSDNKISSFEYYTGTAYINIFRIVYLFLENNSNIHCSLMRFCDNIFNFCKSQPDNCNRISSTSDWCGHTEVGFWFESNDSSGDLSSNITSLCNSWDFQKLCLNITMRSTETYGKSSSDIIYSSEEYSTTYSSIENEELEGTAPNNYEVDSSTTAINYNTANTEAETTQDIINNAHEVGELEISTNRRVRKQFYSKYLLSKKQEPPELNPITLQKLKLYYATPVEGPAAIYIATVAVVFLTVEVIVLILCDVVQWKRFVYYWR